MIIFLKAYNLWKKDKDRNKIRASCQKAEKVFKAGLAKLGEPDATPDMVPGSTFTWLSRIHSGKTTWPTEMPQARKSARYCQCVQVPSW